MEKNKTCQLHHRRMRNTGFTLVELVVVLALLAILMGITVFGGIAWQAWIRFNHEDTVAEEIYYAAQNQLIELDASGAAERTMIRPLKDGDSFVSKYILAQKKHGNVIQQKLSTIVGANGKKYTWNRIWKSNSRTNTNQKDTLSILTLSAKKGAYNTYVEYKAASADERLSILEGNSDFDAGTVVLFDLISSYISDETVLNGAILLEFSPEAKQVLSVLYSDQATELGYGDDAEATSVLDRRVTAREPLMLGYYGVEQLTERIKGKGMSTSAVQLEIRNGEVLELILRDNEGDTFKNGVIFKFSIYNGDSFFNVDALSAMTFSIPYDSIPLQLNEDDLSYAASHPITANVSFKTGKYADKELPFRFPVWMEEGDIHIVLDAADIQAQTSVYGPTTKSADINSAEATAFRNTYSFYRFGLSSDLHYIYSSVKVLDTTEEADDVEAVFSGSNTDESGFVSHEELWHEGISCGECTAFASYERKAGDGSGYAKYFEISNARHLYNMRYETEFKTYGAENNVFILTSDIDWAEFTNRNSTGTHNYFMNSYDDIGLNTSHVTSGIEYKGNNKATGGTGDASDVDTDTANMPFPSFRCLGIGDRFLQENAFGATDESGSAKTCYTIRNLTISFAANVVYGVYDEVIGRIADSDFASIKTSCLNGDFTDLLGLTSNDLQYLNGAVNSSRSGLAQAGALPLGLFCENLGTISNITLDDHVVRGMQDGLADNGRLVYTCMVGGFVGNNLGQIDSLTLLSTNGITHVNGRKDVGGILGRQSFVASIGSSRDVSILNMKNYGSVTGMENVGGIVGRVYVDYVRANGSTYYVNETPTSEMNTPLAALFHDGYDISDSGKSMTNQNVTRAESVKLQGCVNYGKVSGDELLADHSIDVVTLNSNGTDITAYGLRNGSRCAYIGGIVGIAMDGLMYNGSNMFNQPVSSGADEDTKDRESVIMAYFGTPTNSTVVIEECGSYVAYSDEELSADNPAFARDCYVGGIAGYARLVEMKGIDLAPEGEYVSDGVPVGFVIGNSYVGGIAGCSDMTKYTAADGRTAASTGKVYNAINYNNVIGRKCVGGVAGAFGVGDENAETISFRDPASNEASMPSKVYGEDGVSIISNLLNTGLVLSLKTNTPFGVDASDADAASSCGGVAGAVSHRIIACDNIQSEAVKGYTLNMITDGQWKSVSDISIDSLETRISASVYGGCGVGGIVGWVHSKGKLNTNTLSSYVDAIVYGEDFVGGGVGFASDEAEMYNCYPYKDGTSSSGMIVLGKDIVGGLLGETQGAFANSAESIQAEYGVYGRYAVGGVTGRAAGGAVDQISYNDALTGQVSVNGIAYVGGGVGILEDDSTFSVAISHMDVTGKFFAGGTIGAVAAQNESGTALDLSFLASPMNSFITTADTVHVKADIYAGGIVGLYADTTSPFTTVGEGNTKNGALITLLANMKVGDAAYADSDVAYNAVAGSDITGVVSAFSETGSYVLDFENAARGKYKASVEAELFAGGLFGYVPNRMQLSISGFTNEANLLTTGYVGSHNSATLSVDAYGSGTKFSYLGGVVGRTQKMMVLQDCQNLVSGIYSSGGDKYYYAENASFLGGLTEVNAGIIQGNSATGNTPYSVNTTDFDYSGSDTLVGVGAFAGVNGSKLTDGDTSGVIRYCSNQGLVKAKNAAGIFAAFGGKSLISYSENRGRILSTGAASGSAAGIAGIAVDGIINNKADIEKNITVFSCVNLGEINITDAGDMVQGHGAGIVYDTAECGDISMCRNYGIAGEYAITGKKAWRVYANMEVGGLGADPDKDPVGSTTASIFERNFYLYGSVPAGANPEVESADPDHWSKQLLHWRMNSDVFYYLYIKDGSYGPTRLFMHGEIPVDDNFITPLTLCDDNTEQYRDIIYDRYDGMFTDFLRDEVNYPNTMFVDGQ